MQFLIDALNQYLFIVLNYSANTHQNENSASQLRRNPLSVYSIYNWPKINQNLLAILFNSYKGIGTNTSKSGRISIQFIQRHSHKYLKICQDFYLIHTKDLLFEIYYTG